MQRGRTDTVHQHTAATASAAAIAATMCAAVRTTAFSAGAPTAPAFSVVTNSAVPAAARGTCAGFAASATTLMHLA